MTDDLPPPFHGFYGVPMFSADQMRAYGDARAAAAEDKTRVLREALDLARNGLAWYIDMHPDEADDSDAETMTQIDAAIRAGS